MILVDTSVWIDHFRAEEPTLRQQLVHRRVVMHELVLGELSMGHFAFRRAKLDELYEMKRCPTDTIDEAYAFVEQRRLFGRGIGFTDARLLLACLLNPGLALWTRDKRLSLAASDLNVLAPFA